MSSKNNRRFTAYSNLMINRYGRRMQKVSINAGFTCPNRDGTKAYNGCTFCNNDAFCPSHCTTKKSIAEQINEGMEFHKKRYKGTTLYIAYFQSYSNTYAALDKLKDFYNQALSVSGITGLVIGTRPDCISDDILDYLSELNKKYHIAVEYGIESCNNKILEQTNRCHTFEDTVDAIIKTNNKGIDTGGHLIFGLPGESREDIIGSAKTLSDLPLSSIKFHQLQIFKGTRMEEEYLANPQKFNLYTLQEYIDLCVDFTEQLSPSIAIERIASEAPQRFCSVQPWNMRYYDILLMFEKRLEERDTCQGRLYNKTEKQR